MTQCIYVQICTDRPKGVQLPSEMKTNHHALKAPCNINKRKQRPNKNTELGKTQGTRNSPKKTIENKHHKTHLLRANHRKQKLEQHKSIQGTISGSLTAI
jgi:hypothetical protein